MQKLLLFCSIFIDRVQNNVVPLLKKVESKSSCYFQRPKSKQKQSEHIYKIVEGRLEKAAKAKATKASNIKVDTKATIVIDWRVPDGMFLDPPFQHFMKNPSSTGNTVLQVATFYSRAVWEAI